jgi:DHA3 family macrolide efflux protein-like MFS transporter
MNDRRSFYFLWVSQMMANAGDVLYIVGLIQIVYLSSGSVLTLTFIPLTITFSRLIGSFLTPLLLHRFPLRRILLFSMFGKIVVLSAVFLLKDEAIVWILLLVSIIAFLDGWASPIRQAMLPEFVGKAALPKANSIVAISDNTVNLVSWPIGAFFVSLFGGGPLLIMTVSLYIVGWLLTFGIKTIPHTKKEIPLLKEQLSRGWKYCFSHQSIRSVLILDTLLAFTGAVWISAILYVYVEDVLGKSEAWWGYINAFFSGGCLVGGVLFYKLAKLPANQLILGGSILTGMLTFWFINPVFALVALLLSFLLGVVGQLQGIAHLTVLQSQTETDQLGTVFSTQEVLVTGAFGLATFIFGWTAESLSIEIAFYLSAALSIGAGVYAFCQKNKLTYQLDE